MRLRTTLLTAVVAGSLAAALPVFADAALDGARARWQSAALTSYEYGYQKYCDCHRDNPPETVITVRGGSVAGVRHRPAGTTTEVPGRNPEYYWTVDGLFELIAAAQARGVQVRATYDADLGFPREIYIDYDTKLIGDELDVRLSGVTRLDGAR
jgi:hypothetical protein